MSWMRHIKTCLNCFSPPTLAKLPRAHEPERAAGRQKSEQRRTEKRRDSTLQGLLSYEKKNKQKRGRQKKKTLSAARGEKETKKSQIRCRNRDEERVKHAKHTKPDYKQKPKESRRTSTACSQSASNPSDARLLPLTADCILITSETFSCKQEDKKQRSPACILAARV